MFTLPENMSLPRFYYGVLVDFQSFVYFVVFCRSLFDAFSFDFLFDIFKLLTIVLHVLRFTASDYPFDIFKLLSTVLSFLRFTASDYPFGIFKLLTNVLSVLRFTASDYLFGIFKLFLQIFDIKTLRITFIIPTVKIHIPNSRINLF